MDPDVFSDFEFFPVLLNIYFLNNVTNEHKI